MVGQSWTSTALNLLPTLKRQPGFSLSAFLSIALLSLDCLWDEGAS